MTISGFDIASTMSSTAELGGTNSLSTHNNSSSAGPISTGQNGLASVKAGTDTLLKDRSRADTTTTSAATQVTAPFQTFADVTKSASAMPIAITGMHKWSGRIVNLDEGIFTAELTPLDHEGPAVLADFELADLDADDPESVTAGDLFYLSVRTVRDRGRRVTRTSNLLLRRLGSWSLEDLRASAEEAQADFSAVEDYVE